MKNIKKGTILVVNDNDMNCDPNNEKGLEKMSITDIGFSAIVANEYDLIVYEGKKGTKILKNKYFSKGIVK